MIGGSYMIVYLFDAETHRLIGYRKEAADYELQANETIIPIPDGLENIRFEDGKWVGETVNPSHQMIAKLGIDIAQAQQMIAKLATMITPQGGKQA